MSCKTDKIFESEYFFFSSFADDQSDFNGFKYAEMNSLSTVFYLFTVGVMQVEHLIKSENFQNLLNSGEKFDAVIVELFVIDAVLGLGQHFDCPVIGVNTFDGVY